MMRAPSRALGMTGVAIAIIAGASVLAPNAAAKTLQGVGYAPAQAAGGYACVLVGNAVGRELLSALGDLPSSSLSGLSVVAVSFGLSLGTSATVHAVGRAFDDAPGSATDVLLTGLVTVGGATVVGVLIGRDDWKTGAAIGSVFGRYLVPITATALYHVRRTKRGMTLAAPALALRF